MTVVDMIFIYFYQSQSSSRFNLQSSRLNIVDEKRTVILQRDWWNKSFKTNREIESSLQDKLIKNVKVRNENIVEIQRHEELI